MWLNHFSMRAARPPAARMEAAHHHRTANLDARHDQLVDVELMVVLGICNRTLERLANGMRNPALAERQRRDGLARRLVTNEAGNQIQLAGADALDC